MTLAEKIPQLNTFSFTSSKFTPGIPRLGVPEYTYHTEGLHGVRDSKVVQSYATLYPQVTAMAATGNMTLVQEMATVMGTEFRALNNMAKATDVHTSLGAGLSIYGPTINIIRSGLWYVIVYLANIVAAACS
jgi:beta-glucosidase-like glycosyl hydrolase